MPNGSHEHDDEQPPRTRRVPAKYQDPVQTTTSEAAHPRRSLKRDHTSAIPSLMKLKNLVSAKGVAAVAEAASEGLSRASEGAIAPETRIATARAMAEDEGLLLQQSAIRPVRVDRKSGV